MFGLRQFGLLLHRFLSLGGITKYHMTNISTWKGVKLNDENKLAGVKLLSPFPRVGQFFFHEARQQNIRFGIVFILTL